MKVQGLQHIYNYHDSILECLVEGIRLCNYPDLSFVRTTDQRNFSAVYISESGGKDSLGPGSFVGYRAKNISSLADFFGPIPH